MSNKRQKKTSLARNTALCYVRQSYTRFGEADDLNSPERQRANIQAKCDQHGWIPEWYEDVGGHRSGRSIKNRPQWRALKARLKDPDVMALVANDLSRLHRKGWRIGDLIEFLAEHDVDLVLAAPGRDVDTSTLKGRMFVQFAAIIDEFYAEDISQRAKESIQYRKSLGKTVGMPPFGTIRDDDGYLMPSPEGAWLLPNGKFVAGTADSSPEEGAIWRGYYDAAHYILKLFATGRLGLERIAYVLNDEGWAFRDRYGEPRRVDREDIRRVVANWAEYGGVIQDGRGKDSPGYDSEDVGQVPFNKDRSVFPIELLRVVAKTRQQRSRRRPDIGRNRETFPYALSGITYCARCEQLAKEEQDPRLRTRLRGKGAARTSRDIPRYRHKPGVQCGTKRRSVRCETYEPDFARLIKLLTLKSEAIDLMTELAIQANTGQFNQDADLEKQKEEAIALCKRRIDAAVHLYKDGEIDRPEYLRIREANEREIVHWESRTTETEQLARELALCLDAMDKMTRLWDISEPEDRRGLAHSLFDYIVYDLDAQRIVDFRLKPWADRYLTLRAGLYELEAGGKEKNPPFQEVGTDVPPRDSNPCFSLERAAS